MNADDQPHHPRESTVVEAVPRALLIDGTWRSATAERTFEVEDPSTTTSLCAVPDATADDALRALDAADRAQSSWAAHPPRQRGEILRRAFEIINSRHKDLSLLMTLEMGKPLPESRAEVTYAAEFFRWFAEEAVRVDGDYTVSPNGTGRVLVMRQPVGPSLMVTPWNFPMAMGTRKIGPAVAAGCTMVLKPAHQTPLTMLALGEILTEAGLPDGVLNIITARDAGAVMGPLISDPRARKLTFTGSTAVGRTLIEQSAEQVLKVSMELGGNAPFLVFGDADVDAAVEGAMLAKMRNVGEACTAANRFYLHRDIADEFTDKLTRRMRALRVGRGVGDDVDVDVGPLIDASQLNKVTELVDDAVHQGARVLTGGKADSGPGYYYQPTVLTDVPATARLTSEEVFGPVAPISTFTDEDEALTAANNTEFGLVSYAYTQNMRRALRVSESLQTGMVGLNQGVVSNAAAPFGGVKQSGIGREGGKIGIDEYLETKYVAVGGP